MVNHIIEKQLLEIQQKDTKNINFDKISTIYNMRIVPVLEEIFNNISVDSQILRIDKLEIDTGVINAKDFERELPSIVKKAVLDKLSKANKETSVKEISIHESRLDLIKHFLETGNLPWWSVSNNIEIEAALKEVLNKSPDEIRKFLLENLKNEPLIIRLVSQFNLEVVKAIISLLVNQKIKDINYVISSTYKAKEIRMIDKTRREKYILLSIFSVIRDKNFTGKGIKLPADDLIENVLKKTAEKYKLYHNEPIDTFRENCEYSNETETKPSKGVNEYYIDNSGLALLFPYMLSFFENLHLIVDNNFKNYKCAEKAVHLLQYIVSGETECPEYLLTLNKILCGIDVNFPVEKNILLEDFEKKEADELVGSVIKNWAAVKNTSPEGFKDAFIKRKGILVKEEFKWILKVERKTYDILLEKIPWSYCVIKLPWMKKILYVEW